MVEVTGAMAAPKTTVPTSAPGQGANQALNSDPSKATNAKTVSAPFKIEMFHQRQSWLKALIYGKHGAGKTELLATAVDVPEMNDVLFISAESGDLTVQGSPRIQNKEKLFIVPATTFKQVAHIQQFLQAYCIARDANDVPKMRRLFSQVTGINEADIVDPPRFRTVIIDSLTEVEVYCVHQLLNYTQADIMKGDDMEVAGWPEFRKNNEMVKMLVRAFRDLPMHALFSCAESWSQDEQKKFHYTPALTGKLSAQVQGFVDLVGWITVGTPTEGKVEAPRRVFIQPIGGGPKFDAKNRLPAYKEAFFDNPSMADIVYKTGLLKP